MRTMDATTRENLRHSLLRFTSENRSRFGLPLAYLHAAALAEGRRNLTLPEVEFELDYLSEKGLLTVPEKLISPEVRAWRITAAGRDHLAILQTV